MGTSRALPGAGLPAGYRVVFALAGAYNLAFAAWAVVSPLTLFGLASLEPPLPSPLLEATAVGVALFGFAYAYAALRPDRARPIIILGLLAKIFPPAAWLVFVGPRAWPMILANDVAWWLPFALYLRRTRPRQNQPRH